MQNSRISIPACQYFVILLLCETGYWKFVSEDEGFVPILFRKNVPSSDSQSLTNGSEETSKEFRRKAYVEEST